MNAIRVAAEALEIPFLVHFTRTTNLPSIFEHGIVPRDGLAACQPQASTNDEYRLDNQLGANCLSIAFPNALMLWKLRQENPGTNWAVLILSPSILWEMPCAFCPHNAAANEITSQPIANFQTVGALGNMFSPLPGIDRGAQNLKNYDPTDVQAEVLVFGVIPPAKIAGGVFQRTPSREQHQHLFEENRTWVHGDRGFFSQRWHHRGGVK
ncbi:DUF4433 domain-containing protein [bacterium]|nr:MAG: DUF4433 domain-containing protein [bacterium]